MYLIKDTNGDKLAECSEWADAVIMTADKEAMKNRIFVHLELLALKFEWEYTGGEWENSLTGTTRLSTWRETANDEKA